FFSSRRRHTRWPRDWSSDVCSSDLDTGSDGNPQMQEAASPDRAARNPGYDLRHVPRIDRLRVLQFVVVHHLRLGAAGKTLLALALARDVVLARAAVVAARADLALGERIGRHGGLRLDE